MQEQGNGNPRTRHGSAKARALEKAKQVNYLKKVTEEEKMSVLDTWVEVRIMQ